MTTKMLHCVIFKIYYIIHGLNFKMLIRKSYLALSFGRTQVIGIGGIPIIATPFITLKNILYLMMWALYKPLVMNIVCISN